MYIFSESARQPWEVVQPPPMRSIVTRGEPQSGLAVTGSSCYVGVWLLGAPEPPLQKEDPAKGLGKSSISDRVCVRLPAPPSLSAPPLLSTVQSLKANS